MENIRFLPMVGLGIHKLQFLKPNYHHIHSSYEKSIIERTIQYIKERTERFDDYFPCRKDNDCKLQHVMNGLSLFVDMHNMEIMGVGKSQQTVVSDLILITELMS